MRAGIICEQEFSICFFRIWDQFDPGPRLLGFQLICRNKKNIMIVHLLQNMINGFFLLSIFRLRDCREQKLKKIHPGRPTVGRLCPLTRRCPKLCHTFFFNFFEISLNCVTLFLHLFSDFYSAQHHKSHSKGRLPSPKFFIALFSRKSL